MAKAWANISGARKVFHQVVAEIWDDGFQAHDSSLVDPTSYRKLVGSLMYLVNTWPDL